MTGDAGCHDGVLIDIGGCEFFLEPALAQHQDTVADERQFLDLAGNEDDASAFGGKLPDAIGIPEEELRQAATMAVCKINIDSDIRLAMTAGIRRVFSEKPDVFDPRTYLSVARDEVRKMVAHKIEHVLGSAHTL